jgi:isopentenyl-diphosphate delta-isomerase
LIERWDVLDINGKKQGYTKCKGEVFLPGEYHKGASLWIANEKGELLIQKRAASKSIGSNLWSITGGRVQAGESSAMACLREVREEIGLVLSEETISFLYRSVGPNILFDDYVCIVDFPIENAILRPSEVSEVKWAVIDEIKALYDAKEFMYNDISDISKVSDFLDKYLPGIRNPESGS